MTATDLPIVCDVTALSADQRSRLDTLIATVIAAPDEVRELPDGYALRYADPSVELLADLTEFVGLDRQCCAFVRYRLTCEPGPGAAWLELTGAPGAKEAIAVEGLRAVPRELVHGG